MTRCERDNLVEAYAIIREAARLVSLAYSLVEDSTELADLDRAALDSFAPTQRALDATISRVQSLRNIRVER